MINRPFLSDSTKIYDESCFTSAPAQFCQNQLLVTHGQQRRTFDTTTTSVTGQPFSNFGFCQPNSNVITPTKHTTPSGVSYSFPSRDQATFSNFRELGIDFNGPTQQNFPPYQLNPQNQHNFFQRQINPNPFQTIQYSNHIPPPPLALTLEQQIALNELQKHALETMLLYESLRTNPFKLNFHYNNQTDTNDLKYSTRHHPIKEIEPNEPKNDQKPESLYSESARRRSLNIPSLPVPESTTPVPAKTYSDKQTQNQPAITSVETQSEDVQDTCACECCCGCSSCVCGTVTQTRRKVTFDKEYKPKRSHSRRRKRRTSRGVNDDSDSSSNYEDCSVNQFNI